MGYTGSEPSGEAAEGSWDWEPWLTVANTGSEARPRGQR